MFAARDLFGFIYLVRKRGWPPFTSDEIKNLDYIAEHIGSVLKIIKTTGDLKKYTKTLLNLEKASRAIAGSIELAEFFDLIVRTVRNYLMLMLHP